MAKDFSSMENSNTSLNPGIHEVSDPRRRVLMQGAGLTAWAALLAPMAACQSTGPKGLPGIGFQSVPPGVGVVDGEEIPYLPKAIEQRNKNRAARWTDDPEIKCYLPGVPRATYMPFPFQIIHNASSVFMAYEYAGAVRDILFKDPGPAETDSWMGQSVGKWEGDTLVVVTTGFNDQTWFDRSGTHHSNQLKVTERFTMSGANHIRYEATMEDPEVFTAPWKISLPLYRRMEPDARLMDFKCVEFVEELIFGEHRRKPLPRQ